MHLAPYSSKKPNPNGHSPSAFRFFHPSCLETPKETLYTSVRYIYIYTATTFTQDFVAAAPNKRSTNLLNYPTKDRTKSVCAPTASCVENCDEIPFRFPPPRESAFVPAGQRAGIYLTGSQTNAARIYSLRRHSVNALTSRRTS